MTRNTVQKQYHETTVNMIARMLGAAFLAGGYVFRYMGIIPSIILLVITLFSRMFFNNYLIDAIYYTNAKNYRDLTAKLWSEKLSIINDVVICIMCIGTLTSYQIVSSMSIQNIIAKFVTLQPTAKYIIRPMMAAFFIFPLTLLKSTTQLTTVTPISVISILLISVIIIAYFVKSFFNNNSICNFQVNNQIIEIKNDYQLFPEKPLSQQIIEFVKFIPMLHFMLSTSAIPIIMSDLKGPRQITRRIFKYAFSVAIVIGLVLYSLLAFSVSLGFGKYTADNALKTFAPCKYVVIDALSLIYAVVLNISFTLILQPPRIAIMQMFKLEVEKNYGVFVLIGAVYVIGTCIFACLYEQITSIFGIFTSVCGFVLYFLIPTVAYYKMPVLKKEAQISSIKEQMVELQYYDSFAVTFVALFQNDKLTEKVRESQIKKQIMKSKTIKTAQSEDLLISDASEFKVTNKQFKKYDYKNEYKQNNKCLRLSESMVMGIVSFAVCGTAFWLNLMDFIKK